MIDLGTVMLIDDEEIDQKQYKRVLERSGAASRILQFTYAEDALSWLSKNTDQQIDVVFLDINMPRMNGFEFLESLRSASPELNLRIIIMLTTSLAPHDRSKAMTFDSVKGFMSKPLLPQHLAQAAQLVSAGH